MRILVQRSFLLFFVFGLLLSSIGLAWTQSKCLFTGIQKFSWQAEKPVETNPKTQIKRSPCFEFKHFQIKQQSAYSPKQQVFSIELASEIFQDMSAFKHIHLLKSVSCILPKQIPLQQSIQRALLQVYLI